MRLCLILICLGGVVFLPSKGHAMFFGHDTTPQLDAASDVVVIAEPITSSFHSTKPEKEASPARQPPQGYLVTSFRTDGVLKGKLGERTFRLVHFSPEQETPNGEGYISFPPQTITGLSCYWLAFLKPGEDGGFVPATGQLGAFRSFKKLACREDLVGAFDRDGGIAALPPGRQADQVGEERYCYPGNMKVKIRFRHVKTGQDSIEDVILSISEPYSEKPYTD